MPDQDEPTTIDAEDVKPAKKGSKGSLFIVLAVVLACAGGAAGWTMLHGKAQPAKAAEEKPAVNAVMHLESFVLNITDAANQNAYLRVGIDLGLHTKETKKAEAEGGGGAAAESTATAIVRDTVLSVLMRVKAEQISTPEGKAQLKQELLHALQQRQPQLGICEVYYTEFLVQS